MEKGIERGREEGYKGEEGDETLILYNNANITL